MWFENSAARPSTSLRQSRCSSQATPNQVISWAPAALMRSQAASRVSALKVPEASVTTNTSKPSSSAASAGKATQTSVTTPAMISCFLPVALTALTKASLSQALIWPGRGMKGASGNRVFSSGASGPLGPSSKLVVEMVGSLEYLVGWFSARTVFLDVVGAMAG